MIPVDLLETLNCAWHTICATYDVTAALPDMQTLFLGVDLTDAAQASEAVIANMVGEVTECLGRFSPWYKKPAQAFGLALAWNSATHRNQWILSAQAIRQWQPLLALLAVAIERNVALILSADLIDSLEATDPLDDPCVMASCLCTPPRIILVNRSVLANVKIRCDACQQPFQPVEDIPGSASWIE